MAEVSTHQTEQGYPVYHGVHEFASLRLGAVITALWRTGERTRGAIQPFGNKELLLTRPKTSHGLGDHQMLLMRPTSGDADGHHLIGLVAPGEKDAPIRVLDVHGDITRELSDPATPQVSHTDLLFLGIHGNRAPLVKETSPSGVLQELGARMLTTLGATSSQIIPAQRANVTNAPPLQTA